MKDRWITGLILAGIAVVFAVLGGHYIDIPLTLVMVASSYDMTKIQAKKWPVHMLWTIPLCTLAIAVSSYFRESISLLLLVAFLIYLAVMLIVDERVLIPDVSVIAYLHVILFFALRGYNLLQAEGKYAFACLIIATCLTDVGAYIVGRHFGKHKLIERLSPKKTVEGSFGGIAFGLAGGILSYHFLTSVSPLKYIVICLGATLVAQVGDLFFSAVKRHYGIKDYGNYLKGHGGMLDRLDSILFTMMYAGLVLTLLGLFA